MIRRTKGLLASNLSAVDSMNFLSESNRFATAPAISLFLAAVIRRGTIRPSTNPRRLSRRRARDLTHSVEPLQLHRGTREEAAERFIHQAPRRFSARRRNQRQSLTILIQFKRV